MRTRSEEIQKKYFVIDERKKGDSFGGERGIMNKDDALQEAKNQWNALTLKEKENVEYFALMRAYADEDGCILMDTAEEVWTPDK